MFRRRGSFDIDESDDLHTCCPDVTISTTLPIECLNIFSNSNQESHDLHLTPSLHGRLSEFADSAPSQKSSLTGRLLMHRVLSLSVIAHSPS